MRLTIQGKLIGLSVIALALLATIGFMSHSALRSTFGTIQEMQMSAEALRHHLECDMMHDALRADVLASFLASDADVAEHAAKFRELLAENLKKPLDEKTLTALSEAEPVLENYINSAETIVALAATDRRKAEARRAEFDQAFSDLEGAMETLSDQIETGATAAVNDAQSTVGSSQTSIFLLGIVAILGLSSLAWRITRSVTRPLNQCVQVFSKVAAGDLTQRVASQSSDELGDMSRSFDGLVLTMHEIVSQINRMSQEVAAAATEIAASAEEMAAGMDGQSNQVVQVSASVEEMTASIEDVARKSSEMATAADESGRVAAQGGQVVQQTIAGMSAINEAVSQGSASVEELGRRSVQIGKIIEVIDDIADQTNLLALNAAIEAARAGEHGRGFAVVADEVRKLAERTTTATKEVVDSVRAIQDQTKTAVDRMKTGSERVTTGVALAEHAGGSLRSIVDSAKQVALMVQSIAAAAAQQSATSGQITQSMQTVSEVTRQTSDATSQSATAATALSQKAEELQALVGRFKLNQVQHSATAERKPHKKAA